MMRGLRTSWPLVLVILSVSCFSDLSEARHHHHKLSPAEVVGTVYCDTCFQDEASKGSHFISGATVAVECQQGSTRPAFYQEVQTDKKGTFKVHLPFSVSKHVKQIEGCNVKLVKSSEPYCAVASTASSSAIHLKEKKRGKHIFSAGFFTFKPLKQPGLCNQQPSVTKSNLNFVQIPTVPILNSLPNPLAPVPDLPLPPLPPLPNPLGPNPSLPLPTLPPLPPLPGLPELPQLPPLPGLPSPTTVPQVPTEEKTVGDPTEENRFFFLPPVISPPSTIIPPVNPLQPAPLLPNPLQPGPTPLIPNPLQPPSPPTLLPPVPQLPPLPLPPLPEVPVPGVLPTPTPATPTPTLPVPTLPVPLPPLAPVIPGIPGIPSIPSIPGVPLPPATVRAKKAHP